MSLFHIGEGTFVNLRHVTVVTVEEETNSPQRIVYRFAHGATKPDEWHGKFEIVESGNLDKRLAEIEEAFKQKSHHLPLLKTSDVTFHFLNLDNVLYIEIKERLAGIFYWVAEDDFVETSFMNLEELAEEALQWCPPDILKMILPRVIKRRKP